MLRRNKALAGGDVCPSRARLTKVEAELINSIPGVIPVDQKESEDQKIVCEESDRDDEKSKKSRGPQRPAEGGQGAAGVDEKSKKRKRPANTFTAIVRTTVVAWRAAEAVVFARRQRSGRRHVEARVVARFRAGAARRVAAAREAPGR